MVNGDRSATAVRCRGILEANHLLFHPPQVFLRLALSPDAVERFRRREHFGLEEAPQELVRVVLPHVQRGGQQQEMATQNRDPFGHLVASGRADVRSASR